MGVAQYSYSPPVAEAPDIIDTCAEARTELEYALNKRDAITPAEAMTYSGRAEWEKWRDRGIEVKEVRNRLCWEQDSKELLRESNKILSETESYSTEDEP